LHAEYPNHISHTLDGDVDPLLRALALRHRQAALPAVTGEHYEGGHWLGTFAVYLTSGAGIARMTSIRGASAR
jgi:hypothetical protein